MNQIDIFIDGESSENYTISKNSRGSVLIRKDGERIMYDDIETIKFYEKCIPNFRGDSLVVGLGLGLLGYNYAKNCTSFDYLEIDNELIEFVKPKMPNLNYFLGDAFNWQTEKKYDTIFLDIFHKLTDNYENEIIELFNKFKSFLKKDGEISYLTIQHIKPI
jgi:hypothetical protein